ncbi:MAG: YceD family protein [Candidatus Latescibacterota bacterium]
MKIDLFGPQEREEVVELTGDPEELDIQTDDYALEDGVRVTCRIIRNGDLARVEGNASALLKVPCARCLDTFEKEVCGTFSFLVKRMPMGIPLPQESAEENEEAEDLIYVGHDATSFDITEYVREAIILALPMKILCREDCKGLCIVCGSNLNEGECGCRPEGSDARWKGLESLFEKK